MHEPMWSYNPSIRLGEIKLPCSFSLNDHHDDRQILKSGKVHHVLLHFDFGKWLQIGRSWLFSPHLPATQTTVPHRVHCVCTISAGVDLVHTKFVNPTYVGCQSASMTFQLGVIDFVACRKWCSGFIDRLEGTYNRETSCSRYVVGRHRRGG